jgi:hypothetical protein
MENTDNDSLWNIHARMYDLYESLETDEELVKMLEVTKYMRDRVPIADRVIVAETINGRTVRDARTGLIYKAYDSGNIAAAKEFTELSLYFSDCNDARIRNKERCHKSTRLCKDIVRELGL